MIVYKFQMQTISAVISGEIHHLNLPNPDEEVMRGVRWGAFDQFFTPAYWASQLWMLSDSPETLSYRLGTTLKEETAACMLGGHGITAEMCLAAYDALRQSGLLSKNVVTENELASVLKERLVYENRNFRYRFPNKKAKFLAPALNALTHEVPPQDTHRSFRSWFLRFEGIGLKTASWITRNWLNSADIAILDIHVVRGGRLCGLFNDFQTPERHYFEMECVFLDFAHRIGANAAKLDVLMWQQMRTINALGCSFPVAA